MFKIIRAYKNASNAMKGFYITFWVYMLAIIVTTIYAYARLDYVRSYAFPKQNANTHPLR